MQEHTSPNLPIHRVAPAAEPHASPANAPPAGPLVIAVINEKGGVGKSTFSAHLAMHCHEQGLRVAFIDADGQRSSSKWLSVAQPEIHLEAHQNADALVEAADKLAGEYDVVLADGPANLAETTRALMLVADAILVPVGLSVLEMEATAETVRLLSTAQRIRQRSGGGPAALLVLNRLRNPNFTLTKEAVEAAPTLGLPVAESTVSFSDHVADSPGQRTALWRMGPRAAKPAKEMRAVLEEFMTFARAAAPSANAPTTTPQINQQPNPNPEHGDHEHADARHDQPQLPHEPRQPARGRSRAVSTAVDADARAGSFAGEAA